MLPVIVIAATGLDDSQPAIHLVALGETEQDEVVAHVGDLLVRDRGNVKQFPQLSSHNASNVFDRKPLRECIDKVRKPLSIDTAPLEVVKRVNYHPADSSRADSPKHFGRNAVQLQLHRRAIQQLKVTV